MSVLKPRPAHLLVIPQPDPKPSSGIILDVKTVRSINPNIKALVKEKGGPTPNYPMTEFVRNGQELVLIPRGAGTEVERDGVKMLIVHVSEVIGFWPTKENKECDYE
jgi:co-chaperonin GroES (HSP10)